MRINSISHSINFKSSNFLLNRRHLDVFERKSHPVLSNPQVDYHSNYTYFFREDVAKNWRDFINIIEKHFQNAQKVNVFNFACSDGTETYSFLMTLLDELGENEAEKFLPIHAYDIDKKILTTATEGKIFCSDEDGCRISKNIPNYSNYCKVYYGSKRDDLPLYFVPNKKLSSSISFNEGDFAQKIDELPAKNNLIMCRNMWYYLGEDRILDILCKLQEKIDESSLVVIGDFDRKYVLRQLNWLNFEEIALNIFRKKPNENT